MIESIGNTFLDLCSISGKTAIVVLVVFLMSRVFRSKISPAWRSALWILIFVRLACPLMPQSKFSLLNCIPRTRFPESTLERQAKHSDLMARWSLFVTPNAWSQGDDPCLQADDIRRAPTMPTLQQWLALCWLLGVGLLGAKAVADVMRLQRNLQQLPRLVDDRVERISRESQQTLRLFKPIEILEDRKGIGPAVAGVWRPRLLLPAQVVKRFSDDELRFVILHELIHIRRMDLLFQSAVNILRIVHWFNPLIWLASWELNATREAACDNAVLAVMGNQRKIDYGRTILRVLEQCWSYDRNNGRMAPALQMLGQRSRLKGRILMLLGTKDCPRMTRLICGACAFLAVGLFTMTDARTANSQDVRPNPVSSQALSATTSLTKGSDGKAAERVTVSRDLKELVNKVVKERAVGEAAAKQFLETKLVVSKLSNESSLKWDGTSFVLYGTQDEQSHLSGRIAMCRDDVVLLQIRVIELSQSALDKLPLDWTTNPEVSAAMQPISATSTAKGGTEKERTTVKEKQPNQDQFVCSYAAIEGARLRQMLDELQTHKSTNVLIAPSLFVAKGNAARCEVGEDIQLSNDDDVADRNPANSIALHGLSIDVNVGESKIEEPIPLSYAIKCSVMVQKYGVDGSKTKGNLEAENVTPKASTSELSTTSFRGQCHLASGHSIVVRTLRKDSQNKSNPMLMAITVNEVPNLLRK